MLNPRITLLCLLGAATLASCSGTATPDSPAMAKSPVVVKHFAEVFHAMGSADVPDSLAPVFPNPFNRVTGDSVINILFTLSDTASVVLLIQNPLGDSVAVFKDEVMAGGIFSGAWAPVNAAGIHLREGLYFITLRIRDDQHSRDYINSELLSIEAN